MDLLSFIIAVVFISLSGVLMPGPIFAVAISEGRKNKYAGLLISLGHATIEIPIMLTLFFFGGLPITNKIKALIGVAGGAFLLYLASSSLKEKENKKKIRGWLAGFVLSSLNPYFIMWWITIGLSLAIKANAFGIIGLVSFIFFHEICDFTWYSFVSFSSEKGVKIAGMEKFLKVISFSLLLFFGVYFIYSGLKIMD
ncbi:MAG: LysE family transporter [Thermoplasmata archaeon]|nr:LysE family transporter [Thermoplasmata archaeon]